MSPECSYSHSVVFFSIKQLRVQQSPVQTVRWDSHTPYRFTTIIYTLTVQQTPSNQQLELDLITSCSNRFIIILSVYMLFCHSVFTKPGSRISGSMYQKPWIKKKKNLMIIFIVDWSVISLTDWLTTSTFKAFIRRFCPKRLAVIHSHTDGDGCHASGAVCDALTCSQGKPGFKPATF